jgi:protein-S-isoprenylcysteine O-methyltransferase
MHAILRDCAGYLWLTLGMVWLVGALTAKRTERRQSPVSLLLLITPEIAAFSLLFGRHAWTAWLQRSLVSQGFLFAAWAGLALTAVGILFAIWARLWIGRNWSGRVTIKEQHELIQGGPYAIVRHPIYSGFLLAILGTAIIHGEVRSFLALPVAAIGWTFKLRLEESFMTQQFGAAYVDYKRRVKALVPFVV